MLARIQSSRLSGLLNRLTGLLTRLDSWITWAFAGLVIGLALGVNFASVVLVAVGLILFIVYLWLHGPARGETEGRLFASGGAFMMAWLVGFVVRGLDSVISRVYALMSNGS